MSEAEQTKRKVIGKIFLPYNHNLIASAVNDKKFRLSLVDNVDNKELELDVVDKNIEDKEKDPLFQSAKKQSNFTRSVFVYIFVAFTLTGINYLTAKKWPGSLWWCLLPIVLLGVGLLVQGLDVCLPWGQPKHVDKVYRKKKAKESQENM